MDVKLHVAILREHSQYLAQLCTAVSTHLRELEQALSEQNGTAAGDTVGHIEGVTDLHSRLSIEAEIFCKRLHLFLAGTKTVTDSTAKMSQPTSADGS
jgi:hypothetical protein